MSGSKFCEGCGAALTPSDKFCISCGRSALTAETQPVAAASAATPMGQPAMPQPQMPATPAFIAPAPQQPLQPGAAPQVGQKSVLLPAAIAAVVVVGAAVWWFAGHKAAPKSEAAKATQASSTAVGAASTAAQPGEDFIGRWYTEDGSGTGTSETITITREGPILVGVGKDKSEGRMELTPTTGSKLEGKYVETDGDSQPVTAEILSDKNKMVLTLAPPASEYQTVILWRDKGPQAENKPSDDLSNIPGIERIPGIDKEQATQAVATEPEVKKFIDLLQSKGKKAHIDVEQEDLKSYSAHVYEIVDDGGGAGHTATFGWYKVDRATGKVTAGM
jgi:hypothetical protein